MMADIPSTQNLHNLLIMRPEGTLGDAVITSGVYREIKRANPLIKITVACFGPAYLFLKTNPYIDSLFLLPIRTHIRRHQRWLSLLWAGLQLRRKHFDLILDSSSMAALNWHLCKKLAGGKRVLDYTTSPVQPFGGGLHLYDHQCAILKLLGISNPSPIYDLYVPEEIEQRISSWLQQHHLARYILLNTKGSILKRSFNQDTLHRLCAALKDLNLPIVIPTVSTDAVLQKAVREHPELTLTETLNLFEMIELVRQATLVITPDTSVVHIASAYKKPCLVFYNNLTPGYAPNNPNAFITQTARENVNDIAWKEVTDILQQIKTSIH